MHSNVNSAGVDDLCYLPLRMYASNCTSALDCFESGGVAAYIQTCGSRQQECFDKDKREEIEGQTMVDRSDVKHF